MEATQHGDTCFATITYDDEHIPRDWSLSKSDVQRFVKRLRRRIEPDRIKYFTVGEYGTKSDRPHYHAVLFGLSMLDDNIVHNAWGQGFVHLGELNKKSANYITGYILKDMTGKDNQELQGRTPEFMLASKSDGGIGAKSIKVIAEALKKHPYWEKAIIREFKYGKSKMPLGRHLTEKMNDYLGITDEMKRKQLFDYQEEIFQKHLNKEVFYWDSLVQEMATPAKQQEKRKKIYKKREKL